jgi:hypothetical protein
MLPQRLIYRVCNVAQRDAIGDLSVPNEPTPERGVTNLVEAHALHINGLCRSSGASRSVLADLRNAPAGTRSTAPRFPWTRS